MNSSGTVSSAVACTCEVSVYDLLDFVGSKLSDACNRKHAVVFGMSLRVDCECSHSEKQVFVPNHLLCIARSRIQVKQSTHKGTFPGVDCEGLHSSHEALIKTIIVRAVVKRELGVNLKPFSESVKAQIVSRVFVLGASDRRVTLLSMNGTTAGERFLGCLRKVRKTSVNRPLYVSTSGSA